MKEKQKENRDYLTALFIEFGNFHCVEFIGEKWTLYSDKKELPPHYYINHREVLPQEVVFDYDHKDINKNKFYHGIIANKLKRYKVEYKSWTTSGKGIHTHIIFPDLLSYPKEDRSMVKKSIIDFFFGPHAAHAKVDYQLCTRHMVRAEYGTHEKSGGIKLPYDEFVPRIKVPNKIPPRALDIYEMEKSKFKSRKPLVIGRGFSSNPFPCISYFMGEDFCSVKDGRKRAKTILLGYFYKLKGDEALDIVREWNDYKLNRHFNDYQLTSSFKGVKKMYDEGRSFGCTSCKYLLTELGKKEDVCKECVLK